MGRVFHEVVIKELAGVQSSEGFAGVKDLLPRWRSHMVVGWSPQFLAAVGKRQLASLRISNGTDIKEEESMSLIT
jgi:hypothetical protein